LSAEAVSELTGGLGGLPSAQKDDDQDAKRFDLLMLKLQLTLLRSERGFERLQTQAMGIASLLEEKAAIPMVAAQLSLLQEIQTDAFWEGIDVAQLENVRRKLRSLVKLISAHPPKLDGPFVPGPSVCLVRVVCVVPLQTHALFISQSILFLWLGDFAKHG
jgi:type I restriction enzyme, R subunit